MSFPRKRESIISDTYKYLDSSFRGNDNYLRLHYDVTYSEIAQAVLAQSSEPDEIQPTVPVAPSEISQSLPDQSFQIIGNLPD